ncbi:MAG: hypothetical protein RAO94_13880 [Candidatus Stygibacter australis]|nr:hypothetical protein [Candidatus Stygibacter australis]MDP8323430.1 hypothetical protein [Candidatus Stygibacter australis]
MKKVLIIYIILVMGISLIADTPITSFKAMIWNQFINDLMEIKIDVAYDEAENRIYMTIPDEKYPSEITITEEYRKAMYDLVRRFMRKQRQAIEWKEEYDLELGKLPITESRFKRYKTWHNSRVNSSGNFFSQNTELHQFILFFSPMTSREDDSISKKGFKLYFWTENAEELEKAFNPRSFKKYWGDEKK